MTPLPTPSRRVLAELAATILPAVETGGHGASRVQRAFVELAALLDMQDAVLAEIDQIEAMLIDRLGFPRVMWAAEPGSPPIHVSDVAMIRRQFGTGPVARRAIRALRLRQRRFREAASTAGLPKAQARIRTVADEIDAVTAGLLIAPAATPLDLVRKLVVLIAMTEPGPEDAAGFPGAMLRLLLTDLISLADCDTG